MAKGRPESALSPFRPRRSWVPRPWEGQNPFGERAPFGTRLTVRLTGGRGRKRPQDGGLRPATQLALFGVFGARGEPGGGPKTPFWGKPPLLPTKIPAGEKKCPKAAGERPDMPRENKPRGKKNGFFTFCGPRGAQPNPRGKCFSYYMASASPIRARALWGFLPRSNLHNRENLWGMVKWAGNEFVH